MTETILTHPHLLFSLISICSSVFLFFLLLFQFRSRGGISFAGLVSSMALWQVGKFAKNLTLAFPLDWDVTFWSEVSFVGAALIYPLYYHMCSRLSLNYKGIYKILSLFGYASAIFFIALEWMGYLAEGNRITEYGFYRAVKTPYYAFVLIYFIYMFMGLLFLYPAKFHNIPHLKKQAKAIFFGALFGFGMGGLEFVGILFSPLFPLADLSPCVFGGALYWAIYRYNIIGGAQVLKSVLFQVLYFFILWVLIGSIYMGCKWILVHLPIQFSDRGIILLYTFVFFALTPLYIYLLRYTRRRFFPVRFSYRKLFSILSTEFNRTHTPDAMFEKTIEVMSSQFNYSQGRGIQFPYVDQKWDYTHFKEVGFKKECRLPPHFFNPAHFEFIASRQHSLAQLRLGIPNSDEHSRTLKSFKQLNRLKADLIIPVVVEKQLLGLLLFDQKRLYTEPWPAVENILTSISSLLGNHVYQYYLLKARTEGEHLSQVGMMAATLAHEIKNPLEGIYGAAQIVKEENPTQAKFTGIILKDAERLNGVVQRFLQFSNPFNPTFSEFDLKLYLQQFIIQQNTIDKNRPIQLNLPSDPMYVQSDQRGIEHILINLVQNARRFQPDGIPILLEVKIKNEQFTISVEDKGDGVPEENRAYIFSPFFTSSSKGTGLGLSISKKIAKALGGDLTLTPLNPGSRFTLSLPGITR